MKSHSRATGWSSGSKAACRGPTARRFSLKSWMQRPSGVPRGREASPRFFGPNKQLLLLLLLLKYPRRGQKCRRSPRGHRLQPIRVAHSTPQQPPRQCTRVLPAHIRNKLRLYQTTMLLVTTRHRSCTVKKRISCTGHLHRIRSGMSLTSMAHFPSLLRSTSPFRRFASYPTGLFCRGPLQRSSGRPLL